MLKTFYKIKEALGRAGINPFNLKFIEALEYMSRNNGDSDVRINFQLVDRDGSRR